MSRMNLQTLDARCAPSGTAMVEVSIAWRYALRELNAFVIPDISYAQHNTDGSLDLYDPETGEAWLADRAVNESRWHRVA